jgi:hypothetical protein
MATVTRADGEAVSREEQLAALIALGMDALYAEFVLAMEAGEVSGDVVVVLEESESELEWGGVIWLGGV